MTFKQRVLSILSKPELLDLGRHFELNVKTNMTVEELVKRLAGSKRAALDKLLAAYSRDALKKACAEVGLPGSGTEKQVLVDRLLGADSSNGNGQAGAADPEGTEKQKQGEDGAEAYEHRDTTALARPDVGTQPQFKKRREAKKYRYDSSLSPTMEWDGSPVREEGEALLRRVLEAGTLEEAKATAFELKRMSKPFLNWAGKAERLSFDVPTLPLFVHERMSTKAILETLKGHKRDKQTTLDLFGDPERSIVEQVLKAYEYQDRWVNRMILGDSLVVMNSLLHYEGLGGQVQMIYVDPPYGVEFGSNFQPFVRKRDVTHNDDNDMTREPEMVQAYRDTWNLNRHSYLTYMRDRLLLSRELLASTGSIFVQISAENMHHVHELLDEVFGPENFISIVPFRKKTMPLGAKHLESVTDYLIWYAKDIEVAWFQRLYEYADVQGDSHWNYVELPGGKRRKMTREEVNNHKLLPSGSTVCQLMSLYPVGINKTGVFRVHVNGKPYDPPAGNSWFTNPEGMAKIIAAGRAVPYEDGETLRYLLKLSDSPVTQLTNLWSDTSAPTDKVYAVQTSTKVVERCLLMTTKPGDLVLDPTCGSGTTAYVAEKCGRRWITTDVSRVPLALARQRLLTATFSWFRLIDEARGPSGGFVYAYRENERGAQVGGLVRRRTRGTIANDEAAEEVLLPDKPETETGITRVTGPFAFEATIPTPIDAETASDEVAPTGDAGAGFSERMLEVLRKSPILRLEGNREVKLRNVRPPAKTLALSAEALQVNGEERPVAFVFGPENGAVSEKLVFEAAREANVKGYKHLFIVGFAIQPNARQTVEQSEAVLGVPATYVQASPDLLMGDLLKNMRSSQIFSVCGLPDVSVKKGAQKSMFVVELNGVDVFDPVTMKSESHKGIDVPCWFLDTDYNGLSFHVSQAFFPRTGAWDALKRALRTEYEEAVFDHLAGATSAPFEAGEHRQVAVKVIDDRGNELMVVKPLR